MARRITCIVLMIAAAACGRQPEAPTEVTQSAPTVDYAGFMEVARIPGMSVARIEGGEVVSAEHLGVADAESGMPVTADMLFEAASLSKPVFATIVLRLVERGEFSLDRPLTELLPFERLAHDPRAELLTAELVLSHRTGLPNWGAEKLDFIADPGERYGYSGEGYVYLQRVLEASTGLSLDELVRREVFEPLGMSRSRFSWSEGEELPLVTPHDLGGSPQQRQPVHEGNAAYSLHTTAEEYARFVTAWMNGELLREDSREAALSPLTRMTEDESPEARQRMAWALGWGIQLPEEGSAEAPIYWHWGDNGPSKAFVAFDLEQEDGIVWFANSMNGLAIGPALITDDFRGGMDLTFEWIDYERWDAPGFVERLEGSVAENAGRYGEAVAAFRAAMLANPEDETTARRVEWLTELLDAQQRPLDVPSDLLERYVGTYGPRRLTLEDGALHYQRDGGRQYRLIPLTEKLFALDGLTIFRLEVDSDLLGTPQRLVGHYVDGTTDESARD